MKDTIYREAAIDALGEGAMVNYQASGHGNGLIKAIDVIKGLPSARLEQRWTSCSERLPEEMTRVLTTIKMPRKEPKVRSGLYSGGLFMNDNGDTWRSADKEVKAWMPLPEPYRAKRRADE